MSPIAPFRNTSLTTSSPSTLPRTFPLHAYTPPLLQLQLPLYLALKFSLDPNHPDPSVFLWFSIPFALLMMWALWKTLQAWRAWLGNFREDPEVERKYRIYMENERRVARRSGWFAWWSRGMGRSVDGNAD
jgi:hypothetical protein